jgi:hypothetical protein
VILRLSPLPGAVRTGLALQGPVRPVVIVVILRLFQLCVEEVNVLDVADVEGFEMSVKVRLEFGAIVGLNDMDAEREAPEDVIDEFIAVR